MKHILFLSTVMITFSIVACSRAKEADMNGDDIADVLVKGNNVEDLASGDNILVVDDIVVNAVSNQQWVLVDEELKVVHDKTFKMEYNHDANQWQKVDL